MEPVQVSQRKSLQEKFDRLEWRFCKFACAAILVGTLLLGMVLGWICHDHVVVHVKRSSSTSISTTQGGGQ